MTGIRRVSQLGTTGESTYVDGSIQTVDIAANAVTQAKLSTDIPLSGFRNVIINGDFKIWQRTTSPSSAITATSTTTYYADRWACFKSASGGTISRQTAGLEGFQYCARLQRDSGQTAVGSLNIYQSLETVNSIPLAGKTVTISLWARAGANFSGSNINVGINTGTGTDQNIYTGYTGNISQLNAYQAITTTWARYSFSTVLSASATEVGVFIAFVPTGTAGAADYIEITGVQLEVGPQATPFEQRPIGVELALCQRYYFYNIFSGNNFLDGYNETGGYRTHIVNTPQPMRASPSVGLTFGYALNLYQNGAGATNNHQIIIIMRHVSTGRGYVYIDNISGDAEL